MDVSRYNEKCQKALHLGWRLARKLNHANLECEHVAISLVQNSLVNLDGLDKKKIEKMLHAYLVARPRIVGTKKVEFGPRLDRALDKAEEKKEVVDEELLWKQLISQSTILKHATSTQKSKSSEPTTEDLLKIEDEIFEAFEDEIFDEQVDKGSPTTKKKKSKLKNLEKYAINLTQRAHDGELDPVIGRDVEVRRVLEVLGRKRKNNPLVTGPAGVGKQQSLRRLLKGLLTEKYLSL